MLSKSNTQYKADCGIYPPFTFKWQGTVTHPPGKITEGTRLLPPAAFTYVPGKVIYNAEKKALQKCNQKKKGNSDFSEPFIFVDEIKGKVHKNDYGHEPALRVDCNKAGKLENPFCRRKITFVYQMVGGINYHHNIVRKNKRKNSSFQEGIEVIFFFFFVFVKSVA